MHVIFCAFKCDSRKPALFLIAKDYGHKVSAKNCYLFLKMNKNNNKTTEWMKSKFSCSYFSKKYYIISWIPSKVKIKVEILKPKTCRLRTVSQCHKLRTETYANCIQIGIKNFAYSLKLN